MGGSFAFNCDNNLCVGTLASADYMQSLLTISIKSHFRKGLMPGKTCILQVLGFRPMSSVNTFRLCLSNGKRYYSNFILQLQPLQSASNIRNYCLIKITQSPLNRVVPAFTPSYECPTMILLQDIVVIHQGHIGRICDPLPLVGFVTCCYCYYFKSAYLFQDWQHNLPWKTGNNVFWSKADQPYLGLCNYCNKL